MDIELLARLLPAFAFDLVQVLPRLIIHAIFAAGIYRDADAMRRDDSGPFLVSPKAWAFASFTCGFFFSHVLYGFSIVIFYWMIHYSALRGGKKFAERG